MLYEIEVLVSEKRIYRVEGDSIDAVVRVYDGLDDPNSPLLANPTKVFTPDIDLVCMNDAKTGKTEWVNDPLTKDSLIVNEDVIDRGSL